MKSLEKDASVRFGLFWQNDKMIELIWIALSTLFAFLSRAKFVVMFPSENHQKSTRRSENQSTIKASILQKNPPIFSLEYLKTRRGPHKRQSVLLFLSPLARRFRSKFF